MKIAIASDHAGVQLKNNIIDYLQQKKYTVIDLGPADNSSVDYPDYAAALAKKLSQGEVSRGILLCGTGIGMSIVANKFVGVRAAVVGDPATAVLTREHNDSNVLALAARSLESVKAIQIVDTWLNTAFAGGRHEKRLQKISEIEKQNFK